MLMGALAHDVVEALGATLPSRALASLSENSDITFMPADRRDRRELAVVVQRHRRIAGEDDAIGFRPRQVQQVVEGPIDRLQPIVQRVELAGRLGEAVDLAEPAAELRRIDWSASTALATSLEKPTSLPPIDRNSRSILRARSHVALPQHQAALAARGCGRRCDRPPAGRRPARPCRRTGPRRRPKSATGPADWAPTRCPCSGRTGRTSSRRPSRRRRRTSRHDAGPRRRAAARRAIGASRASGGRPGPATGVLLDEGFVADLPPVADARWIARQRRWPSRSRWCAPARSGRAHRGCPRRRRSCRPCRRRTGR